MRRFDRLPRTVTRRAGSPRLAVTAIFFVNGTVLSSLYARLPALQADLRLADAELGALLLATALGLLLAQPAAAALAARVGSAPVTRAQCARARGRAAAPGAGADAAGAGSRAGGARRVQRRARRRHERAGDRRRAPLLAPGLRVVSRGAVVRRRGRRRRWPVPSAALGASPALHLTALGAILAVAVYPAGRGLLPARLDAAPHGATLAAPSRALAALGLVAFCCLLAEGAVYDWSAVYLRRSLEAGEATAAAGLAAFSLTMGLGRMTADRLADRLGPVALARGGAALGGTSFALALAAGTPAAAIAGFALLGAGLAAVFPLALAAAAARSPQAPAAPAIAAVSTAGYLGLVCGPAAIGLLSGLVGLVGALGVLVALCARRRAARRRRPPARTISPPVSRRAPRIGPR